MTESTTTSPRPFAGLQRWMPVIVIVGTVIAQAAVMHYRLGEISGTLHEVQGAQQANSVQVGRLIERVKTLEKGEASGLRLEAVEGKIMFMIGELKSSMNVLEVRTQNTKGHVGTLRARLETIERKE